MGYAYMKWCEEKLDEILEYMHQTSSRKKLEALEDRMEEADVFEKEEG